MSLFALFAHASQGDNVPTPGTLIAGLVIFLVLATAACAGYAALYRRYVPTAPPDTPEFIREPPSDLPPATVGLLFNSGSSPEKMAATILDLVRRGVLEMSLVRPPATAPEDHNRDDRVLRRRGHHGSLSAPDADFVYELFDHIAGGLDEISLSRLREWWMTHPATAEVVAGYWSVALRREAESLGLLKASDFSGKKVLTIYGFLTTAAFLPAIFVANVWGILFFAIGPVMLMAAQRAVGLTARGAELAARYEAFKRYLTDFGRMEEKPAEAVVMWEQYLPLAIVLGVATEAMDDLFVEAPTHAEYGRAGRAGRTHRRRHDPYSSRGHLVDADEAKRYADYRRLHDPSLPEVRIIPTRNSSLIVFEPAIDYAVYSQTGVPGRVVERHRITGFFGFRAVLAEAKWFIVVPVSMVALAVIASLASQ